MGKTINVDKIDRIQLQVPAALKSIPGLCLTGGCCHVQRVIGVVGVEVFYLTRAGNYSRE